MDGLSGAASVITIVSLALSSSQVIYNTVSGIRNGPENLEQLITGLQSLLSVLQQLQGSSDSLYLAVNLPEQVQRCAANLKSFEKKLERLSSSTYNKTANLCKNFKVVLQSKDLDRMVALIQQDVGTLSLQLQIIQRCSPIRSQYETLN